MLDRIRNEPALVSGLVVVLLNAAAAFGLNLSGDQTAAINAVVVAVLAIVFVRPQVTPTRKIDPTVVSDGKRPKVTISGRNARLVEVETTQAPADGHDW